jgi:hypothetical protein
MPDTPDQRPPQPGRPLFITDTELAPMLGVSVSFLQRDRREAKRIPFIRLGDRCLYDPGEALAAVKALTVGGARSRRGRLAGGSV